MYFGWLSGRAELFRVYCFVLIYWEPYLDSLHLWCMLNCLLVVTIWRKNTFWTSYRYLEKSDPSEALKTAKVLENCRLGLSVYIRDNVAVPHPSRPLPPAGAVLSSQHLKVLKAMITILAHSFLLDFLFWDIVLVKRLKPFRVHYAWLSNSF